LHKPRASAAPDHRTERRGDRGTSTAIGRRDRRANRHLHAARASVRSERADEPRCLTTKLPVQRFNGRSLQGAVKTPIGESIERCVPGVLVEPAMLRWVRLETAIAEQHGDAPLS
jgi:hypothetical protein